MEFVIITGMSGAGKSQGIKILEDSGYYCMDNLPPALLSKFAELCIESTKSMTKVAVVVDIRGGEFFESFFHGLDELMELNIQYKILFLDAKDEVLIKRYKEHRRPHPLSQDGRLSNGIKKEREILKTVRRKADYILDTSNMKVATLRKEITNIFSEDDTDGNISVSISSFGFKYGILLDADLVFDVRFIPNPFYISELKEHSGEEETVKEFVFNWPQTNVFVKRVVELVEFLLPYYSAERKTHLVIGIGCTGGFHRSVAIANRIGEILEEMNHSVVVNHRDI